MFLSVDSEMLVIPHSSIVTLGIDGNLTVPCNVVELVSFTESGFVRGTLLGLCLNTFFMCCFLDASLICENHKDSLTTRLPY